MKHLRGFIPVIVLVVVALTFAGCGGESEPATQITANSATLNGKANCTANENVSWIYRKQGDTTWQQIAGAQCPSGPDATIPVSKGINGLTPSTNYEFGVCVTICENANGGGNGQDFGDPPPPYDSFTTRPPPDTVIDSVIFGEGHQVVVAFHGVWQTANGSESFDCRLDGQAMPDSCTSAKFYDGLTPGSTHTFKVTAIEAGVSDPTPATTTFTVPGAPAYTTVPPDGGTNFYGQFTHALPTDPNYFPLATWGTYDDTSTNISKDINEGLNTYVWVADSTNQLPQIRADGRMHVIQAQDENRSVVGSETNGWLLGDEPDMSDQGITCPSWFGTVTPPNDGRLTFANYGKGLALPADGSGGSINWWSDQAEQNCFANGVNIASVDMYWFTDPYEGDYCCGYRYGQNVQTLRNADASDGTRHPNWSVVELGWPFSQGGRTIAPAELRSATWHSIIAGARGVVYFEHSFGGPCQTHFVVRDSSGCYTGIQQTLKSMNAQIQGLAPVLNAPTVTAGYSASSGLRTLGKLYNGVLYLFAGATTGGQSATFQVQGGTTATVLGEGRSIPVQGGSFQDSFADRNAVHIYRIDP